MWYWIAFVAVVWLLLLLAMLGPFRASARRELQWRQLEFEQKKERIAEGRRRR